MKVREFLEAISNTNMLRIEKDGKEIYTGYLGMMLNSHEKLYARIRDEKIKHFAVVPEITHKEWEQLGLKKPIQPGETAQYSFSDLQMILYYTITI